MSAAEFENEGVLRYRVRKLEERVDSFDKKLDRVQATLNRLLVTIAAGSIGVALSVLVGSGKL